MATPLQTIRDDTLEIIDQVIRLTQSSVIWWEIVSRENKERYPELRGKHVAFFEPVQFHLALSFFVTCYQLFDTRSDSKHIGMLIEEAQKKNPDVAFKIKARIASKKVSINKIKKLRSKVFAHRDRGVNPNLLFQKEGVVYKEMRDVVELVQDVVSDLAEILDVRNKSTVMEEFRIFSKYARDAFVALMDSIDPGSQAKTTHG